MTGRVTPDGGDLIELRHDTGVAIVESLPSGLRRISLRPSSEATFTRICECETRYSMELIEAIFAVKGVSWLCDEILRDEDPANVAMFLKYAMFAYVSPMLFAGKRLLDFGCGAGASTAILGRWLRDTEIVGVDINEELLALARARALEHGLTSVRFLLSPAPDRLPEDLGIFDYISFSAVYEHLLPRERRALLPLLWSALRPGGVLFVNQTPNRLNPVERHTTGLPLLNYMPARLAVRYAKRSPRVTGEQSWESLLRDGVRGASVGEILRRIRSVDSTAALMKPGYLGARDEIDVWFISSRRARPRLRRRFGRVLFKMVRSATGILLTPAISIAVMKSERVLEGGSE